VNLRALDHYWLPVVLYRRRRVDQKKIPAERLWFLRVYPSSTDGRRRRWSGLGSWSGIPPLEITTAAVNEPCGNAIVYARQSLFMSNDVLGDLFTYREKKDQPTP